MKDDEASPLGEALVLIAIAGSVDAIGFLRLGQLFVSFISGDTTKLSVAASQGDWSAAAAPGGIVGSFVLGVIIGQLISSAAGRWSRVAVLLSEALLLGVAVALERHAAALALSMAVAMGMQNVAARKSGHIPLAVTYVTGTLVHFGTKLADGFTGKASRAEWMPYLLLWLSLTLGAVIGAAAYRSLGLRALLLPMSLVLTIATIEATLTVRRRPIG